MNKHLNTLKRTLTELSNPHLDNETLSEIVATELAGEDINTLFPTEAQHIETCLQCAETYSKLVEMMMSTIEEMATVADSVSPLEVYTTILLRQVKSQTTPATNLTESVRAVASLLPPLFTRLPKTISDIDETRLETAATTSGISRKLVMKIIRAVSQNLNALSAYLIGAANTAWGGSLDIETAVSERGHILRLRPGTPLTVPTLSGQEVGDKWPMWERPMGRPLPLNVSVRAERLSDLTCRLVVQVDRPGLKRVDGRKVQISYADRVETAVTDKNGIATFAPIPVSTLFTLDLEIETNKI